MIFILFLPYHMASCIFEFCKLKSSLIGKLLNTSLSVNLKYNPLLQPYIKMLIYFEISRYQAHSGDLRIIVVFRWTLTKK